jgi:hypothetical protein
LRFTFLTVSAAISEALDYNRFFRVLSTLLALLISLATVDRLLAAFSEDSHSSPLSRSHQCSAATATEH